MANGVKEAPLNPQFPTHNAPRVWLITSGDSPVGISLARHVLAHGDYVVTGVIPAEFERYDGRTEEFKAFLADVGKKSNDGWKDRLRVVKLDVRCVIRHFYGIPQDRLLSLFADWVAPADPCSFAG